MIEVKYGDFYRECVERLLSKGFNSFHIDFGDQDFMKRHLMPWDKVNFLENLSPSVRMSAHLMCKSGASSEGLETIAKKCIQKNFEIIYVHPRSFGDLDELKSFKYKFFKDVKTQLGLVSEVEHTKDEEIINFINENSVPALLQMGVPIGKGGQKFTYSVIEKIEKFQRLCLNLSVLEIDGGLTLEVVENLKNLKINRFSGWSLVDDQNPKVITKKAIKLREILV